MGSLRPSLPSGRALAALDVAVAAWAVVWVLLALQVVQEVRGLQDLSRTVTRVGGAVEQTAGVLERLQGLPFGVGDEVGEAAERVAEAGRSAVESGRSSRESVRSLSVLLGIAIGVIPSVPVLAFYLPLRIGLASERQAIVRAAASAGDDPAFQRFLAMRAVESLSYRRLCEIADEPWRDLADGRHRALARAELERLGIPPSAIEPAARRS